MKKVRITLRALKELFADGSRINYKVAKGIKQNEEIVDCYYDKYRECIVLFVEKGILDETDIELEKNDYKRLKK